MSQHIFVGPGILPLVRGVTDSPCCHLLHPDFFLLFSGPGFVEQQGCLCFNTSHSRHGRTWHTDEPKDFPLYSSEYSWLHTFILSMSSMSYMSYTHSSCLCLGAWGCSFLEIYRNAISIKYKNKVTEVFHFQYMLASN